jgi:ATP adenylyltransferase
MSNPLYAPWRMDYIRGIDKPDHGDACFLCQAAQAATPAGRKSRLVLWTTEHCVVVINRYPYTNGHLLVAPKAHKADFEELTPDQLTDLGVQTTAVIKLLKDAMSPQGFNVGINLGRCAGAGVPGHLHQHVVPRWNGDTNFMSVVADIRIVPQAMTQLYEELMRLRESSSTATPL